MINLPHRRRIDIDTLVRQIGQVIGTSDWIVIDQSRIDAFATLTLDDQFIHTDPIKAAQTPFGGTIAHGFLTLSLLSPMAYDAVPLVDDAVMGVNYGFDKVRFLTPVKAGASVRGVFTLMDVKRDIGQITTRHTVEVEIMDTPKPALIADWIIRTYLT